MSRAEYCYIVMNDSLIPQAAFTVKYEMLDWLAKSEDHVDFVKWKCYRCRAYWFEKDRVGFLMGYASEQIE